MPLVRQNGSNSRAATLTTMVMVVAVLYFAREVFIPFALALLLSFLLGPLVTRLEDLGLKRVPAVICVFLLGLALFGFGAVKLTGQLIDLAEDLPNYQQNLELKIQKLKVPKGGGVEKVIKMFGELEKELPGSPSGREPKALPPKSTGTTSPGPEEPKPIPVEVHPAPATSVQFAQEMVRSLMHPLATAGIVAVFTVFMLIQREDLRNRFLRLVGAEQMNTTTHALDDAAGRVSRYLRMQLLVNACYGIPVGVGLFFIGVPNPILWGFLATFLRFVPYAGPFIAAALPIGLALAVDSGWTTALLTGGLFVALELITNNVLEPWLYGSSAGVSTAGLLVATVFWTWLWGPIGLLLATPLTVCLAVLGKYVSHLEFLSVLLSDSPVLTPAESFYQRMLAMDQQEATQLADTFLETGSLEKLYDTVIIPALSLAEQDRHRGTLTEERQRFLAKSTRELIEELSDRDQDISMISESEKPPPAPVLCVPGHDEADELTALMLSHLLARHQIRAAVLVPKPNPLDWLAEIKQNEARIVCISSIPPFGLIASMRLFRHLRRKLPELKMVLGLWNINVDPKTLHKRLTTSGAAENVVTTLQQAVEQILALVKFKTGEPVGVSSTLLEQFGAAEESPRLELQKSEKIGRSVVANAGGI